MDYKDYYKILGVDKKAAQDEIKKAFRKLAVKYHPDKNSGDKTAEAKFKEINEANEVLGDSEKRKKYDTLGENWNSYRQQGGSNQDFDWSRYANQEGQGRQGGQGSQTFHSTDFGDMFGNTGGSGGFSDFFESLFGGSMGGGSTGRTTTRTTAKTTGRTTHTSGFRGQDMQAELSITLEEAFRGTEKLFDISGQSIKLKIKPGIADGQALRLPGKGYSGSNGGKNGDLMIIVRVAKHPEFIRIDNDLHYVLPVDIYTSILGGKIELTTFKGKINVNIAKETSNNKTLRLKELGMPVYGKENQFGDLYVKVELQTPKNLTPEEIKLFKQLADMRKN